MKRPTIAQLQNNIEQLQRSIASETAKRQQAEAISKDLRELATKSRKAAVTDWIQSVAHLNRAIADTVREGGGQ